MAEAKPSIADRLSPVERAKLIAKLRFLPSHPDYELMMGAIDALRDLAILVDPPFTCQGDWSCVNCYLGKRPCLAIPALASTLPEPRAGEAKGWKLVPEIPTEDMLRAMRRFQISGSQWAAALAASPLATPTRPTLTERLQQKCSDWNTYWRSPDAHGVNLSVEEATELLADALGVEVDIATPKPQEREHFARTYEKTASDLTLIDWWRLGVREGERAHDIVPQDGDRGEGDRS